MQKIVLYRSDTVFVYSKYMENKVKKYIKKKKIKIIKPIFNYCRFSSLSNESKIDLKRELGIPFDKKILLTARRLTPRTGVIELIESFNQLNRNELNDFILIIIGKGELEKKIEQICLENNNIKYIGFVDETILPKYMRVSDVFVLPTKDLEGLGIVLLESMALNVPVVVSNKSGGAEEFIRFIDDKLIFDFKNINYSLNETIKYACSIKRDYSQIVKQYDRIKMAKNIYEELIK